MVPNRFYPTCTTLATGKILVTAGRIAGAPDYLGANTPMIFDSTKPVGQQWGVLPDAEYCDGPEGQCTPPPLPPPYDFHIHQYPFMFQLSNALVLYCGSEIPDSSPFTRTLRTVLQVWDQLLPIPDPILGGSAVMYGRDLIMKAGGQDDQEAYTIAGVYSLDATSKTPEWKALTPMNGPGGPDFYLIALPDGKILAIGGYNPGQGDFALSPELYDPADDAAGWSDMAPMDAIRPRGVHSSAVLLPDARVLIAGSDIPAESITTAQVFYPPYLFAPGGGCATRPEILGVQGPQQADVIVYGQGFTVSTPPGQAAGITAVRLIRLGSATHGWDHDQRSMKLNFIQPPAPDFLWVGAPAHGYLAPPGYYMLFIVDDGVPSEARIVQLKTS